MRIRAAAIPDLVELLAEPKPDARGLSVKTFERDMFASAGLPTEYAEELHTYSRRSVLRGLHFQTPPVPQGKIVFCQYGSIFDVVVDLRVGSPAYGRALTFVLTGEDGNGLYVPDGCAHGFCVLGDEAVVSYRLTAGYSPGNDAGILWDSVGVEWPLAEPVLSDRDRAFPALAEFDSPFVYSTGDGDDA